MSIVLSMEKVHGEGTSSEEESNEIKDEAGDSDEENDDEHRERR